MAGRWERVDERLADAAGAPARWPGVPGLLAVLAVLAARGRRTAPQLSPPGPG